MRTKLWIGLVSLLAVGEIMAQQGSLENGPDWRKQPVITFATNDQNDVTLQTNAVVYLEGGMNRRDPDTGQWVPCSPELTATDEGVVGRGARHSVRFAQNLNTSAAIQIRVAGDANPADGSSTTLKMHLLGLFYESAQTNVLVADLRDSGAEIAGPWVYYRDALEGILADIRYSYTKSGVSQEILIRERLPAPEAFGINSSPSVSLVAISEIVEGPEPQIEERTWQSGQLTERDESLDFGSMSMRMVPGLAFRLGGEAEHQAGTPVEKVYTTVAGRRLILERLPYSRVREQLLKLPAMGSGTNGTASLKKGPRWLARGVLPPPPKSSSTLIRAARKTAPVQAQTDAFVLDWNLVHTPLHDITLLGSPAFTYVVENDTRLAGTTSISPAAVIRFHSGSLLLDGPLSLGTLGSRARKPILTSIYDETSGPPLRSRETRGFGQYVPALVVRADDYTNASRRIEARHPGARIVPDRPTSLPTVRLQRKAVAAGDQHRAISIRRVGGDWTQPLTVLLRTSTNSGAGFRSDGADSSVTIPANAETVDVTPSAGSAKLSLSTESTISWRSLIARR